MRPRVNRALVCVFVGLALVCGSAQQNRRDPSRTRTVPGKDSNRKQQSAESRQLTSGEALGILGAALDSRRRPVSRRDCSHFIHDIYERAGFPYEYASSADLYAGINEFRRVESPQPGDLAVWRGHAGIVVSPLEHSFFSLLRSGPGVDSYDAPYWKRRGRPRFYRYVKTVPGSVPAAPVQTASLKPAVLGDPKPPEAAAADPGPVESDIPPDPVPSSGNLADRPPASVTIPRTSIVNSARPKPSEVAAAFLETCQNWGQSLRGSSLSQSAQSLVVFDRFEVKKVHVRKNEGWVEVQIAESGSLTGSKAVVRKRLEQQRWFLSRRDSKSWELNPAPHTIYLPKPLAARVLAHELAQLTEDNPDPAAKGQEKAELARLLNVLLQK